MKTINCIFIFVCLSFLGQAQTIRRVNPSPGATGINIYPTVQAAHDASVAGDIIYLEPINATNTDYGDVSINRRVTLIGTGYDLSLSTLSSFDKRTVSMNHVNLEQGSMGSRVMGLRASTIFVKDSNCIIERNFLTSVNLSFQTIESTTSVATGTSIINNRIIAIAGVGNESGYGTTNLNSRNTLISNNIFMGDGVYISGLDASIISRNTIYGPAQSHLANNFFFQDVDASTITANIFDMRDRDSFVVTANNCEGTTVSNNLCTRHAGLPANNGNVNSADPESIFKVANPWSVSPFLESNLELSASSPTLTTGPDGTPIGAFSGTMPFVPSGLANIPIITDFSINGIGNVNSPLIINVKAKSHN